MRKKKQMEIYKCGMEAGAAPFEKKYEETAKQIRKTILMSWLVTSGKTKKL